MTTTIETGVCPKCNGTGKLSHFSHVANGDCFTCGGTGQITWSSFVGDNKDLHLEVWLKSGQFWYASLRCRTWQNTVSPTHGVMHEWGKDLFYQEINDAQTARELWANPQIKHDLVDADELR